MFKFKKNWLMLISIISTTAAFADPISYIHGSGATVVDVNAPNASGLSHNQYQNFNVSGKGLILNNSDTTSVTHVGNVAGNRNMAAGPASVILNEVVSSNRSMLNGFIEVAGQKADVIVANPNGITCSGCSFVNAGNATLTTGAVVKNADGSLKGLEVRSGDILIDNGGLNNAKNYAAILAKAIKINGVVQAGAVRASAGQFDYDTSTGAATSLNKDGWELFGPQYAIDVTQLGGISANSIELIGNDIGLGVHNKGKLAATNDIRITSSGVLMNEGAIEGPGVLVQSSGGGLTNQGTITAGMLVVQGINTSDIGAVTNNGVIQTNQADISAGQFTQSKKGELSASSLAKVGAQSFTNAGKIQGTQVDIVSSSDLNNSGVIAAAALLNASALNNMNNSGMMGSNGTANLIAGNKLANKGSCFLWSCTSGTLQAETINIVAPNMKEINEIGGQIITNSLHFNNQNIPLK